VNAVQDLNVMSNFQPEFGRSAGAVIEIVTRSDTNKFHGTAFEYFRNSALTRATISTRKAIRRRHFTTTSSVVRSVDHHSRQDILLCLLKRAA